MSMNKANITDKIPIIVICGATATGKSRLAIDIACAFDGEVINADSMQVYSGMDIATAMPNADDFARVPHHLFGFVPPQEPFSVVRWLELARGKIAQLHERGKVPVIVGGTGLYISSLIDNVVFDEVDAVPEFRAQMLDFARVHGNAALHEKLQSVDKEAAKTLHTNNVKRVVRALEAFEASKTPNSLRMSKSREVCSPYEATVFVLQYEHRDLLYSRINSRVDSMIEAGLLEEAKSCLADDFRERATCAQAIGHKELAPYFQGNESLELCIANLKQKTRNYAKRQMTWFRKFEHGHALFLNETTPNVHVFQKATAILELQNFLKKY